MPGLFGVVSQYPQGADDQLTRMVQSAAPTAAHATLRRRTTMGAFACVHLGVFNHALVAESPDQKVGLMLDGWIWGLPNGADAAQHCLDGYLANGWDFLKALNGEFNLVVSDARDGSILVANDRYGLRPLYYGSAADALVLAPLARAVLIGLEATSRLDQDAVLNHLSLGRAMLGQRTFFAGVSQLPPGTLLRWKDHRLTSRKYWDYDIAPDPTIDESFYEQLAATFRRAVARRLGDGRRILLTLSGGLDSRVVGSALADVSTDAVLALTFGVADSDEVRLASMTADRLGLDWHFTPLAPVDFVRHASEGVRLTEGIDLWLQSYGLVVFPPLASSADMTVGGMPFDVSLGGSYLFGELLNDELSRDQVLSVLRQRLGYFDDAALIAITGDSAAPGRIRALLSESFIAERGSATWAEEVDRFVMIHRVSRQLAVRQRYQRQYLEDSAPCFDNDVVDLILAIPVRDRLHHAAYQRFMYHLCPDLMDIPYQRTLLPPSAPVSFWSRAARIEADREALYSEISAATNDAVAVPYKRYATSYDAWMKTDPSWRALADDLLMRPDCRIFDLGLQRPVVRALVDDHRTGRRNHRQRITQLMTLELLLRNLF